MKKNILKGLALIATMVGFSACTNEAEELFSQENEIKLTSEITPSRVNSLNYQSTQIVQGQQVGVTIIGAKTEHNNVAWRAGANESLTNTGSTLYWGKSDVAIMAYHPFNPNWTESYHTFSVNTDQSSNENYLNSDLLWTSTTASKSSNPISLNFLHKLAKINVTLTSEDIDDLSNATISICGTNITTDFNPDNGELSNSSNTHDIIAGTTTANASTAAAIIVPQTVPGGTQLIKVSHNNKNFIYTLPAEKTFEFGHSYSYTLKIKEKLVEVEVESDNITDWNDEGITGDLEEVVETLLLPDGPTFNQIVGEVLTNNTNLNKIKFIANSDKTSEKILVTDEDGTIGYIVENGEWFEIHTSAREFIANENCYGMFSGGTDNNPTQFRYITKIEFSKYFNTKKVTNMGAMFSFCKELTSLNLTSFNTGKVTNTEWMFIYCCQLTSLDVSNFNTSNVTDMGAMFWGCDKLTSLDVSNFNTSNVTDMGGMFLSCRELTSLDVSNFNTEVVTDMSGMFAGCEKLTSLNVSNFNTSNVTDMSNMFTSCRELTSLNVSNFNTSNVTSMGSMFWECENLNSLNVSNFNTSNVTDMNTMFFGCNKLTYLDLSKFNTEKVTSMDDMFNGCHALASLILSNFNTKNVINMNGMFSNCHTLTSLDLNNFATEKVTDMSYMFMNCQNLTSLNISNFNTGFVTCMNYMFYNCQALTSLDVSNFDTSKVTDLSTMFSCCYSLASLDLTSFSFKNSVSISHMLQEVGHNVSNKPISIKVTKEGYTYLTTTTNDCGINSNFAKFVKPDGTDW